MEELMKKAKEIGFESDVVICHTFLNCDTGIIDRPKLDRFQPLRDHLWMCELQRWLRDNHKIHLNVELSEIALDYECTITAGDLAVDYECAVITGDLAYYPPECGYETYEEALKAGLIDAIDLIAKNKKKE